MQTSSDSSETGQVSRCAQGSDEHAGCGCGGHDRAPAPDEGHRSGCGCHSSPASSAPAAHSCGGGCRGVCTPRRIHAALGLLLTCFIFFHLGVVALGLAPARYDAAASALQRIGDRIPILETALLVLVAAQGAVGIRLLIRSGLSYRSSRCKDDGQLRYFFQRWTAVLLLAFLALHLAMFKLWPGEPSFATVSHRFTLGGNPFLTAFYALALAGIAFHASNGLWTGSSVWGKREGRPRLWLGIAGASGAVMAFLGFIALRAFAG